MAAKTFFFQNAAVNGFGSLSETDPGASTTGTGWVSGKAGPSVFSALLYGTERAVGTFSATDYLVTTHPNPGSGDSFRSVNPYSGSFANANWVFTFAVRAVTSASTQRGRVNFRLWRSVNADGSSATEITSATQTCSIIAGISTSADNTSTLTFNPGAITLTNEYLFVQCEWEITTAGGTTTADIDFRASATNVVTSNFTLAPAPFYQDDWPLTPAPVREINLGTSLTPWAQNLYGVQPFLGQVLLFHFDGPDGSTTFTDATGRHVVTTVHGNVQISTAQSVFGGASAFFDGAGDGLELDSSSDFTFGIGDFTVDFRCRPTGSLTGQKTLIDNFGSALFEAWEIYCQDGQLRLWSASADQIIGPTLLLDTTYHIAFIRFNGISRLYVNGTQAGSDYIDRTNYFHIGSVFPIIGAESTDTLSSWQGWIDELRFIKGTAAWTSDFTPPSFAYEPPLLPITGVDLPFAELPDPRGFDYTIDLRTWTQSVTKSPVSVEIPFSQYDWPLPQSARFDLQTWTQSVTQSPIVIYKPATVLEWGIPPAAGQIQPSWASPLNLALTTKPSVPFAQFDWPINRGPQQPERTITVSYNLNLIGQDRLPTGEIVTDLPPRASQQPTPIFTASYNKNLVGQDQLPTGKDILDLPPQPPLSAVQLRTWISYVNLALSTPPQPKPFAQYDWPLNTGPRQPTVVFTASFNKNLIGQDLLPFSQDYWPLTPAPIREVNLSTWISQVKLLLAVPFKQTDWPVPTPQPQPGRTHISSYNLNLIGQDKLPTGEAVTDLPPQPALSAIQLRTWIQTVNLALVVQAAAKPFAQYNWPLNTGPQQPIQVFTASYNRNLIGQDRLPFRQQDWPLPTQPPRPLSLTAWFDRAKSYLQIPHHQLDWPIPRGHQQPIQTFIAFYNRNLIGKDRLPNRQQDWPLPRDPRRLSDWIVLTNPNLLLPTPPAVRPFNQFYWPVPLGATPGYEQRYTVAYQGNSILPIFASPIPPVPPPTPPEDNPYRFTPGLEWQYYDRIREPGPVGWR